MPQPTVRAASPAASRWGLGALQPCASARSACAPSPRRAAACTRSCASPARKLDLERTASAARPASIAALRATLLHALPAAPLAGTAALDPALPRRRPLIIALRHVPPGSSGGARTCALRASCGSHAPNERSTHHSARRTARQRSMRGGRGPAARAAARPGAAPAPARAAAHGAQTSASPVGARLQATSRRATAPLPAPPLSASRCCPPCGSRRALRRRPSLRVVLPPGAACRAAPAAALQHAPVAPRLQAGGAPRTARPQGDGEQRVRASEGATAAGWRLRFEFVPVGEGPDGRRGGLGRARVRKRCCAAAGVAAAPARQRPRRGELAPRLLACLATCSQQRNSQHFVRNARRRWRQHR